MNKYIFLILFLPTFIFGSDRNKFCPCFKFLSKAIVKESHRISEQEDYARSMTEFDYKPSEYWARLREKEKTSKEEHEKVSALIDASNKQPERKHATKTKALRK